MLDLSFLRLPESFNRWNRLYLSTMARISARRCDSIVAISESTRQDVIQLLGAPPEKVKTIYCGVDQQYRPIEDRNLLDRFRAEKGLPGALLALSGHPRASKERTATGGSIRPGTTTK